MRASFIHSARVFLAEAAHRRRSHVNRDFYWVLLGMAARARLQAAAASREPSQRGLFA